MEVISYHYSGNSFPVVIQKNNEKFLVKLRAGLSGEHSLLSEWIGNQLGRMLGINTLQPFWINLTDELKYDDIYIELRDLIDKSLGINIGFSYIDNVSVFDLSKICQIDKAQQIQIFLFDLLMLNIDRTTHNHNILINDSEIFIADFDSSLWFKDLLNKRDLPLNTQILQCLKANPFYQKVADSQLKTFLDQLDQIDFEKIIYELPAELITVQNKEMICKRIEDKKSNSWNLRKILADLEEIELESEIERNTRIRKNREKLEVSIKSSDGQQ